MNIEQVCKDAIKVVERYLANDVSVYDMMDELCEAQEAVGYVWAVCKSRKSLRMCRTAWHACIAAKNDERDIARHHVYVFWEQV